MYDERPILTVWFEWREPRTKHRSKRILEWDRKTRSFQANGHLYDFPSEGKALIFAHHFYQYLTHKPIPHPEVPVDQVYACFARDNGQTFSYSFRDVVHRVSTILQVPRADVVHASSLEASRVPASWWTSVGQ